MADQHWRGNGGSRGRDSKENMTNQGNVSRASDRSENGARSSGPSTPRGPNGATLRAFIGPFTIGRSRRCDLVIPISEETRTISKIHVRIFPMREPAVTVRSHSSRQKWILQDLNTLNGTALNGMDLMPGGSMELHDGDEILLSSTMRSGVRLDIEIPDDDQSRVIAKVHESSSPQPEATFGASPTWRGMPAHVAASPSNAPRQSPPSTIHKRSRTPNQEENTCQNGNGQDASAVPHDSKRPRRDEGDDKERFMVCSVCLDYYYSSATLSCSHTFCGHCISHWFRTCSSLSCPECRTSVKHMPVRNRALDDLVHKLVGETDTYRAVVRKRSTMERSGAAAALETNGFDLRTHPLIFTRWSSEGMLAFSAFIGKQFGESRVAACRQIGLTEAAIDGASASELLIAAQNLLLDCMNLRAFHEACDRLKIYLHFG